MAEVIKMPRLSDTMTEGVIVAWHKKVGDEVNNGDLLAEIETDKATMELESFSDGKLLYLGVEVGQAVPIDSVIAVVGEEGEDYKALLEQEKSVAANGKVSKEEKEEKKVEVAQTMAPAEAKAVSKEFQKVAPGISENGVRAKADGRIKASPLAKKIAGEKGVDLAKISGTGDDGRIVRRDIENYLQAPAAGKPAEAPKIPQFVGEESVTETNISQMRKTIAKRLSESKFSAPHFYLTIEVNMDRAIESRKSINEVSPVKVSFNDLVIKAAAVALRSHPQVNTSWLGDKLRTNRHIHVGVAVAVEEGLLVPVIRFADNKSLSQITQEARQYAEKAKNKQLQPADWEGNTFTVSNLGMFGIDEFTAIINAPDSAILAVGQIKETPVVKNGEIKISNIMKVTMSCDHRVVDGATGAKFLQTFRSLLEDPVRILV